MRWILRFINKIIIIIIITLFEVNIIVYKLSGTSSQLVRRSLGKYANTMYVNLYDTHLSLIRDIKGYGH